MIGLIPLLLLLLLLFSCMFFKYLFVCEPYLFGVRTVSSTPTCMFLWLDKNGVFPPV